MGRTQPGASSGTAPDGRAFGGRDFGETATDRLARDTELFGQFGERRSPGTPTGQQRQVGAAMQASTGAGSGQFDSGIEEPTMCGPGSDIEHLGDPSDRSLLPVQRVELFPGRSRLRS